MYCLNFRIFCTAAAALLTGIVNAAPTATSHEYVNFNNATHLNDLNVLPAWNTGATGRGVTVAVIDSGIDLGHPDLAGSIAPGRNFVNGGSVQDDFTGHGTQVSGLIAANFNDAGVVGIAYESRILPLKAFDGFFGGGFEILEAIDFAAARADVRVINMSFGGTQTSVLELLTLQNAASRNKVLVMSAGNSGGLEPEFPAAFVDQLSGTAIAVGSLGADGQIAFFSNRAGSAQNFFLLAPGFDVWSTTPGGSFEPIFGTSFSSSYVSGAAALLAGAFPNLSAAEIVDILLVSADDIGAPGADPINGRGRLNIGRAFDPIGLASVPAGGLAADGGTPFTGSALRVAPTLAAALTTNSGLLSETIILDRYDRAFTVDLSSAVRASSNRRGFDSLFDAHYLDFSGVSLPLGGGRTLAMGYLPSRVDRVVGEFETFKSFPEDERHSFQHDDVVLSLSGTTSLASRALGYRFGVNNLAAREAGSVSAQSGAGAGFLNRAALTSPFLGFSDREHGAYGELSINRDWQVNFGMAFQDEGEEHGRQSSAAFIETAVSVAPTVALRLRLSQLWENGSLFGGASRGSFSVDEAQTTALGVSLEAGLSGKLRLVANADFGYTRVAASSSSLLNDFSRLRSDSLGLGLLADNLVKRGDRAGLALIRPLRVSNGDVQLSVPVAMDADERITRGVARLDLEPGSNEIDVEAYYQFPLKRDVSIATNLLLQRHPDHIANQDMTVTVMGSLRKTF